MEKKLPIPINTAQPTTDYPMQVENGNMNLIPAMNAQLPEEITNTAYLPAYLTRQMGKLMRVEFLLAGQLHSRVGILMTVGATYIVLKLYQPGSTVICDMDSIKFISIIHDNNPEKLVSL